MTAFSEHRTKHPVAGVETVDKAVIDPLEYGYSGKRDVEIVIRQPEFTSLCPLTGLPDFGCITVRYRPRRHIVELKSLKYYLLQYRNVGVFYEHLINRILDDLVDRLAPQSMCVSGNFTARGGIETRVEAVYGV